MTTGKKNLKIRFGTDGIRGKADQHPFTPKTLFRLGKSIAKWCLNKHPDKQPLILIGHDTRQSCSTIKKNLLDGLKILPVKIVDGQVLPTPAICQLTKTDYFPQEYNFDCGIVISASHNPYQDNGIKLFETKTCKLSEKDEDSIIKNYEEQLTDKFPSDEKEQGTSIIDTQYHSSYKKTIQLFFAPKFLFGIKIVLDCANGATYKIAPDIFESFGAEIIPIAINPDGKNINEECGALFPQNVQTAISQNNADIGFAFDGDGDRVIAINKNGQIKDGDDLLAILTTHPKYKKSNTIVGTIMTNYGLEIHFDKQNKKLIRTKVGDKFVSAELLKENLPIGGESCGHIILNDYLNTGDGIFVALKTLETIIHTNNWIMTSFEKLPQVIINIPVTNKKDLSLPPFSDIIEKQKKELIKGRAVIRYSGTENLLRIMTEDIEHKSALKVADNLAKQLKKILKD